MSPDLSVVHGHSVKVKKSHQKNFGRPLRGSGVGDLSAVLGEEIEHPALGMDQAVESMGGVVGDPMPEVRGQPRVPPQQAGQDVGPAGTLPPSPGVDAQRPSAPVVPPVLAGPDPRVDSLRGRLQALEARIAAIRAAMDEDRRQAALGGGPTAEQMMRRLSSLRDLRVRARDVNSDVARLREDLNAIWIRLSDDLRASATAIENWGWVTAPRQDQSALPLDLSLTQVVQSARTRAQDEQRMNEARVRQIGELLADTARPEAERQALLAERASRTARPISPDFVEQQVRSAFDVYDRQRSAYRQIEQLFVSSDRAFIDSERLAQGVRLKSEHSTRQGELTLVDRRLRVSCKDILKSVTTEPPA